VKSKNASVQRGLSAVTWIATLLGVVSISGCYKATFVENPASAKREPTHEEWSNHYLFGTVGDKEYDTRDWCPSGTSKVRTGGNAGTTALTIVTLGIYAPRKVYVTCEQPKIASAKEVTP
jgi:hypothetical protein